MGPTYVSLGRFFFIFLIFFRVVQPTTVKTISEGNPQPITASAVDQPIANQPVINQPQPPPYGHNQVQPVTIQPPVPVPPPVIPSDPENTGPKNIPYPVHSQHQIPMAGKF